MEPRAVPVIKQRADWYCGPACGEMAARYYGWNLPQEAIGDAIDARCPTGDVENHGCDIPDLAEAMRSFGFSARVTAFRKRQQLLPVFDTDRCIIALADTPYGGNHYYLLLGIENDRFLVRNPWIPRQRYLLYQHFMSSWQLTSERQGIIIGAPKRNP